VGIEEVTVVCIEIDTQVIKKMEKKELGGSESVWSKGEMRYKMWDLKHKALICVNV
jgi:hypothetical protein